MSTTIEPGILRIFRWYVGIRLGLLLLVALGNRSANPPEPPQFPETGVVLFGLLALMLFWPTLERRMGRVYLPAAIALATLAPIADAAANVSGRLGAGVAPNEALMDYWLPFFLLFVPFILTAWQYRYRWVVVFAVVSTVVDMVSISAVFRDEEVDLTILGTLLAARGILFAFLGFFVTKLVARQRDARRDLRAHAATLEQLATGRERNRLARELHDTLAHSMTATTVQLEAVQALWDEDPAHARELLERALAGTRAGLDEARRAIEDLRASPLDDYGLVGALEWLTSDVSATSGMDVDFSADGALGPMEPHVEQTVYRVAEEALVNAVRHARPSAIHVVLERPGGSVVLSVSDDGVGFDPDAERPGHHGLVGMRERAELIDGDLVVRSTPGVGTTISLEVPRR